MDALFVLLCLESSREAGVLWQGLKALGKHHLEIELLNPRRNKFDKKVKNAGVKHKKEMLINGPRTTQKPYRP